MPRRGLGRHIDAPPLAAFKREPLLPHSFAQNGPPVAAGDVNGDGREDLYIGGAAGYPGHLLLQSANGRFVPAPWDADPECEDLGALLFDADGDGDLDLYVVSGGSEYWAGSPLYQDRLYRNDGRGNFTRDSLALPVMHSSGACVVAGDFDGDGDMDLFVGGRVIPGQYADAPRSYLLRNEGGRFTDVTEALAPGLSTIGMVSAALWTDVDGDGWPDLLLAGEWMPLSLFANEQGTLKPVSVPAFQHSEGWWNSLYAADFDLDGDLDYVVGNLGLNADLKASRDEPVSVHAGFLDNNGSWDAILSSYRPDDAGKRRDFPIHPRDQLLDQMPMLEKTFPDYQSYAQATMAEVLAVCRTDSMRVRRAHLFASCYIENRGNREFVLRLLPIPAQFSPVFGLSAAFVDEDAFPDLLCVGNFWSPDVRIGRYDASIGEVLRGDGKGNFEAMDPQQSGFVARGDVRGVYPVQVAGRPVWIIARNNATLLAYGKRGDWENARLGR